jgi:excisionase family DNA binding protein
MQQNEGDHMTQPYQEEYFTPEEVAQKLKVSLRTIKSHLISGRLKGVKVGRLWRIRASDLEAFLEGEGSHGGTSGAGEPTDVGPGS